MKIATPKPTRFDDELLQHYAFFNFTKKYLLNRHISKDFQVNEAVLQDFRKFLDEEKIPYNEADFAAEQDWVASHIKAELFVSEFGQQEGLKVQAESDPQVVKALELLPQAKELADNARHIIAERASARAAAPANNASASAQPQ